MLWFSPITSYKQDIHFDRPLSYSLTISLVSLHAPSQTHQFSLNLQVFLQRNDDLSYFPLPIFLFYSLHLSLKPAVFLSNIMTFFSHRPQEIFCRALARYLTRSHSPSHILSHITVMCQTANSNRIIVNCIKRGLRQTSHSNL